MGNKGQRKGSQREIWGMKDRNRGHREMWEIKDRNKGHRGRYGK